MNVQTVYPGANASVVETEITERIEEELNSVEGIKTMTSESKEPFRQAQGPEPAEGQVSNITIEFNRARPIDLCAQDSLS